MNKRKIKCQYLPYILIITGIVVSIIGIFLSYSELEREMTEPKPEFYPYPQPCTPTLSFTGYLLIGLFIYLIILYFILEKLSKECEESGKNG